METITCINNYSYSNNPQSLSDISISIKDANINRGEGDLEQSQFIQNVLKLNELEGASNTQALKDLTFYKRVYDASKALSSHKGHVILSKAFRDYFCYLRDKGMPLDDIVENLRMKLKQCEATVPQEILSDEIKICWGQTKRIPNITEGVNATLSRFETLEKINKFLSFTDGFVYGGSLSYGPFYSVRDGKDASNIDILSVVDFSNVNFDEINYSYASTFIENNSLELFKKRLLEFREDGFCKAYDASFSHRLNIEDKNFQVNIHFISPKFLDEITGEMFKSALTCEGLREGYSFDCRELSNTEEVPHYGSITGESFTIKAITEHEREYNRICRVIQWRKDTKSRFYVGPYQLLLIPHFGDYYVRSEFIKKNLDSFRDILLSTLINNGREPINRNLERINPMQKYSIDQFCND